MCVPLQNPVARSSFLVSVARSSPTATELQCCNKQSHASNEVFWFVWLGSVGCLTIIYIAIQRCQGTQRNRGIRFGGIMCVPLQNPVARSSFLVSVARSSPTATELQCCNKQSHASNEVFWFVWLGSVGCLTIIYIAIQRCQGTQRNRGIRFGGIMCVPLQNPVARSSFLVSVARSSPTATELQCCNKQSHASNEVFWFVWLGSVGCLTIIYIAIQRCQGTQRNRGIRFGGIMCVPLQNPVARSSFLVSVARSSPTATELQCCNKQSHASNEVFWFVWLGSVGCLTIIYIAIQRCQGTQRNRGIRFGGIMCVPLQNPVARSSFLVSVARSSPTATELQCCNKQSHASNEVFWFVWLGSVGCLTIIYIAIQRCQSLWRDHVRALTEPCCTFLVSG